MPASHPRRHDGGERSATSCSAGIALEIRGVLPRDRRTTIGVPNKTPRGEPDGVVFLQGLAANQCEPTRPLSS
jgi:hypothetical protein